VSEQPPPARANEPDGPDTPGEPDLDRIARLRARAGQPSGPASYPPIDRPDEPAVPPPAAPPEAPAGAPPSTASTNPEEPVSSGPQSPAQPAAGARWVGTSAVASVVVLAVLAAVTVALAGLVVARVSSVNAVDGTRGDVVGAATSGVATVLSYDYRHLDSDFARAQGLLTPKFRKQYDDTTAKGVRPLAAKYKAISSADVSAAGVVEAGRDRAIVLVFVNQTVTNSQLTAPRLDRSRIKVTLVRSHGRWLIDKLTTL
jgi:Mce-associated membrane protein